jgi:hypothetical protein
VLEAAVSRLFDLDGFSTNPDAARLGEAPQLPFHLPVSSRKTAEPG